MALSNRLKGITIEIGGDTTKLGEAFKDLDRQTGSLQHELIEVSRLLRMDPGNTELLTQQQELYNQQLDNSRERLDRLRQVESQMQEQFRAGEIGEEQMRSFQREIVRTEQSIQRTEQAIRDLEDGLDDTGDAGDEMAKKIDKGLTVASGAIVAAGAALAGAGIMAADEMQKALNQYQASTGTAKEDMAEIEEAMKRIYSNNMGESFDDIARSMAEVKQQTGLTGGALEDATSYALLLRDTFDLDINEGVRGANALIKQFGLDAEEAYNLIAIGAQNGLNQNQDLADQLAEYSVYYAEMGFSAEEMFDVMAAGAETGAFQIDYLNDAVKEFGIRTKDASDGTMQAFADLGLDAEALTAQFAAGGEASRLAFEQVVAELFNMDDQVKQNELGVALFGTKWEDVGIKGMTALMDVQDTIDTTKDALNEINGVKYDSFGEAIQGMGRQIQTGLLIPIGEALLPALNAIASVLQVLITYMNIIGPIIAGLSAGIVAYTAATKAMTLATNGQTIASKAAAVAQGALNAIMSANPIGLVIAAITALIAIFATLWATNEDFREAVTKLWDGLKEHIIGALEAISGFFSATWEAIRTAFDAIAKLLSGDIDGFLEGVGKLVTGAIPKMLEAGKALFTGLWDGIKGVWDGISTWVNGRVEWLSKKLTFWRNSQDEMDTDTGGKLSKVSGSHADGLSYVPWDGYIAELHRGERVLTASENREYASGQSRAGDVTVIQNIANPAGTVAEEQRRATREFKRMVLEVQAG